MTERVWHGAIGTSVENGNEICNTAVDAVTKGKYRSLVTGIKSGFKVSGRGRMDSDNEGEGGAAADCGNDTTESEETLSQYQMTSSKSRATVNVRQIRSRGLSFQLWPAAGAVCWYMEHEFGDEGMCVPSSMNGDCSSVLEAKSTLVDKFLANVVTSFATLSSHVTPKTLIERPCNSALGNGNEANERRTSEGSEIHLLAVAEEIERPISSGEIRNLLPTRKMRILELGAGTGMVGIVAACLGAHVVVTDLPHVIPNVEFNLDLNRGVIEAAGGSVEARVLRWGVEEDVRALGNLSFDLILASDCVYHDTAFEPLLQTLNWLMIGDGDEFTPIRSSNKPRKPNGVSISPTMCSPLPPKCETPDLPSEGNGKQTAASEEDMPKRTLTVLSELEMEWQVGPKPVIILGHVRRWKKDSRFFRMASKYFDKEIVHRHAPEDSARTGPLVYRLSMRSKCKSSSKRSSSSNRGSSNCSSPRF